MIVESWRVFGLPKGQPRTRAFSRGGKASVYDPGTADDWKAAVARAVGSGRPYHSGPLSIEVSFFFPAPKRLCKQIQALEKIPRDAKPDIDNLLKATMDALSIAGVWNDDAQVVHVSASKFYSCVEPGAVIQLEIVSHEF